MRVKLVLIRASLESSDKLLWRRVNLMLITAIQIRQKENTGTKLKGLASITLDGMIAIHDIKI